VPFPTGAPSTPSTSTGGADTDAAVAETARKLIGHPVPDAGVEDLDYKPVRFSQLTGQPTVITFWATWCGPCIEEMPIFTRLVAEYKGALRVLAVATMDTRIDSVNFIKKHPDFTFTYLLDPDWQTKNSRLVQAFGIAGLPTNLFIDATGKVIDYWRGLDGSQALENKIRQLMAR
jgi:cytochrome c biogenesis protein CcmG/thiol:disulfide interchange protein DsbE